jgi:hypothetical protein
MSHEAHFCKTGGRQSRRNEADAPNPAPLISPRFEHEHDDEHEDDLVAATPLCALPVPPFLGQKVNLHQARSSRLISKNE